VEAFDAFPVGANVRFEHYARPCIRNAVCRHAVSLLSAVDRPWGKRTLQDVILDPALPDPVSPEDYCGSRVRAAEGLNDTDFTSRSTHKPLRPWPIDPHCIKIEDLPPVLQLRMKGFKLRDIAQELGCSIPTAHRRVKAAIQEVIHA
jgi:hypothetical protein